MRTAIDLSVSSRTLCCGLHPAPHRVETAERIDIVPEGAPLKSKKIQALAIGACEMAVLEAEPVRMASGAQLFLKAASMMRSGPASASKIWYSLMRARPGMAQIVQMIFQKAANQADAQSVRIEIVKPCGRERPVNTTTATSTIASQQSFDNKRGLAAQRLLGGPDAPGRAEHIAAAERTALLQSGERDAN